MIEEENHPKPIAGEYTNDKIINTIFKKIKDDDLKKISILDLGTGNGYNVWLIREYLKKEEYKNIEVNISCADVDSSQFKLDIKDIKFYNLDFDKDFDFSLDRFDIIIATEVIEHIENPYSFLRNCFSILNKNGNLFLSTPNVVNIYSCFKIFLNSRPYMFCDLDKYGHSMPFFPFMLERAIKFEESEKSSKFSIKKYFNKNILKIYFRKTIKIPGNNRWFVESAIFEIKKII